VAAIRETCSGVGGFQNQLISYIHHGARAKELNMKFGRLFRWSAIWILAESLTIMPGPMLSAQGTSGDKAVALARVLQDPHASADAKGKACLDLMDLGPAAAPAVPALIQQLKDREELLRDFAVTTLSKIGRPASPALPALQQVAQGDPSNDIRQLAGDAIKSISAAGGQDLQRPNQPAANPPVPPPQPPTAYRPAPASRQPVAQPKTGLQLGQYALPDTYLRCTAWTFVAPMNWKMEGGVFWLGRLNPGPAYQNTLVIRDPGGNQEFRLHPIFMFVQTNNRMLVGEYEIQAVMDPPTCITRIILPRCRPEARNVRVIAWEMLPGMAAQAVEQARASGLAGAGSMRMNSARLLVEYAVNGMPMEEMIYCTISAMVGQSGVTTWATDRTFSYRAEKGKLQAAMPVLGTIGSSLQENPQWVANRRQKLQQLVAANSRPPVTSASSGGLSILDVSRQMARNQDSFLRNVDASIAARDRVADVSGSVARTTQLAQDPVLGEQLEVGNGYLHYYRDYYGRILGSDLNAADFYTTYHINATELQQKK
jgi:hypothetical protein